jgi:hypothetical protein
MFDFKKSFQPTLVFMGFPRVEQLKCASLGYAPGLSYKYWTRLERPARDNNSSLFLKIVNYGHIKFYKIEPRSGLIFAIIVRLHCHSQILDYS